MTHYIIDGIAAFEDSGIVEQVSWMQQEEPESTFTFVEDIDTYIKIGKADCLR